MSSTASEYAPGPDAARRSEPSRQAALAMAGRVLDTLRRAVAIYEELYAAPYRAQIHRAYLQERDVLFLTGCSDLLGVPHPAVFYSLELYPEILAHVHEWHRRMGMPHAPDGGFRCC